MSLTARSEPTDVKKEKMFPLLDKRLPAEIRLQIYDWILVSRSPDGTREIAIEVADHHKFKDAMRELGLEFKVYGHIDQKDGLKYELDPDCKIPWGFMRAPWNLPLNINVSLLRTCKQVYNEAVSTLYSKNIFHVSSPSRFSNSLSVVFGIMSSFSNRLPIPLPSPSSCRNSRLSTSLASSTSRYSTNLPGTSPRTISQVAGWRYWSSSSESLAD